MLAPCSSATHGHVWDERKCCEPSHRSRCTGRAAQREKPPRRLGCSLSSAKTTCDSRYRSSTLTLEQSGRLTVRHGSSRTRRACLAFHCVSFAFQGNKRPMQAEKHRSRLFWFMPGLHLSRKPLALRFDLSMAIVDLPTDCRQLQSILAYEPLLASVVQAEALEDAIVGRQRKH
jgi:hypothetical protein